MLVPGASGTQKPAPTILCVFAGKSTDQQPFSVISRWDLKDTPSTLHPSFDQLGMRRASIPLPAPTELDLHRVEDIILEKSVIGVYPVIMGTVIAFACSDGLFDFRNRLDLRPFDTKSRSGKITNMIQAGFSFTNGGPCVDLVPSPNNTVAVRVGVDKEVHMAVMEFGGGPLDMKENLEIVCASLALQHAYSCSNYLNNDDLLLVARKYRGSGNCSPGCFGRLVRQSSNYPHRIQQYFPHRGASCIEFKDGLCCFRFPQ